MRTIVRWCLAPFMKAWVASQQSANRYIPRAADDPHTHAPGPAASRVLVFGTGPAMGWGVVSHDIALPGSLARALSARTGRGADVDVIAQPKLTAKSATGTLSELELTGYDAIVLTLGTREAITLVSPSGWRRDLAGVLGELRQRTSPWARIFVVGILPIASLPGFDTRSGRIAARQANELNEEASALCAVTPGVAFVPLSAAQAASPAQRDGRTYRQWAGELSAAMAPALELASPRRMGRKPGDR
jgi:hypothetical protein